MVGVEQGNDAQIDDAHQWTLGGSSGPTSFLGIRDALWNLRGTPIEHGGICGRLSYFRFGPSSINEEDAYGAHPFGMGTIFGNRFANNPEFTTERPTIRIL